MAFWIACSMKAIKEQIDEQPKIIKLFSINYARDLISNFINLILKSNPQSIMKIKSIKIKEKIFDY